MCIYVRARAGLHVHEFKPDYKGKTISSIIADN